MSSSFNKMLSLCFARFVEDLRDILQEEPPYLSTAKALPRPRRPVLGQGGWSLTSIACYGWQNKLKERVWVTGLVIIGASFIVLKIYWSLFVCRLLLLNNTTQKCWSLANGACSLAFLLLLLWSRSSFRYKHTQQKGHGSLVCCPSLSPLILSKDRHLISICLTLGGWI